jgi:hypothetical protein
MKQAAERAIESSPSDRPSPDDRDTGGPQAAAPRRSSLPIDEDQVMLWLSEADTDGDAA